MSDTWIDEWLGTPRFLRYIDACHGDRERALLLYFWNQNLSLAMMRDIAAFEVAIRNAYDRTVCSLWDGPRHWLTDSDSPFLQTQMSPQRRELIDQNYVIRRDILDAVRRAGGPSIEPGKIVAELSFGFWTRLTETRYEKSFWVPYLHRAYPKGTSRGTVHETLQNVRLMRNRIAHHEPIFDFRSQHRQLEVHHLHPAMLILFQGVAPKASAYIEATSIVQDVLAQRPF